MLAGGVMRIAGAVLACTTLVLAPQASRALGFQFAGTVETVWVDSGYAGVVPLSAVVGEPGSGSGSFDPGAAGTPTGPAQTEFPQSGHSLSVSISGLDLVLPVLVANTSVESFATRFGLTAASEGTEAQALGVDRVEILLGLVGGPGLLPVGVLPTELSETVWDLRQQLLLRGFTRIGPSGLAQSWVVALEPLAIAVPEPGTATLLAGGLAALSSLRCRRRVRAGGSRPPRSARPRTG